MKRKMESNEQVVKKPKIVTPSPQDSKGDDSSDKKDTCPSVSKQIRKSRIYSYIRNLCFLIYVYCRKARMDLEHVHEKNGQSAEETEDNYSTERERQVEMPTFNLMCIYDGTPDEDDNASHGLKQVSGDKSKDGAKNDTGSYNNEVEESTSKAVKDDYALVKTQSIPFQRLWTEEDEKTLVEAITNYKAVHGNEPNSDDLFNMIKGKISFEPNLKQVKNKTRSLKRIKKTPRRRMIDYEKHLLKTTIGKPKQVLKDAEIASIVMTLFQGNEVDEVMMLETGISKAAQLIASGLPTKWKDMIKAQVKQYLRGLEDKKSKLELFLKMMEIETGE